MTQRAQETLDQLIAGNERFRTGQSRHYQYQNQQIADLAVSQEPIACIIACSDSRVSPEIVFDQPLGALFTARIPGNVCADSGRWTVDIAVSIMKVPLVLILGHTGCLAIGQVVDRVNTDVGGPLRHSIMSAVHRAEIKHPDDVFHAAIRENAYLSAEQYENESRALRTAISAGATDCVAGIYDIYTGSFNVLSKNGS